MKVPWSRVVLMMVAAMLVAVPASATFVNIGDPMTTHSWSQGILENGVGNFDELRFQMVNGGPLEVLPNSFPITSFSVAGWSTANETYYPNGSLAMVTGPDTANMTFNLNFQGSQSSSLAVYMQAFLDGVRVDNAYATWNGGGWNFNTGKLPQTPGNNIPAVPEPISMVMLGCLGSGMLAARKLRRKSAS